MAKTRRQTDEVSVPRISLTPVEAAQSAGVSRTRIFEAIRTGKLIARGEGKATVIETAELARWIKSLPRRRGRLTAAA